MFGALYFAQYPTVFVFSTQVSGKWGSWIVLTEYEKEPIRLLTDFKNE